MLKLDEILVLLKLCGLCWLFIFMIFTLTPFLVVNADWVLIKLIRRQKPLSNLVCLEIACGFFELGGQFRLDFSLAQNCKLTSIFGWFCDEGLVKLSKGYYLVEQKHGVEVPVPFPNHCRVYLAKGLAPLFYAHFHMPVQAYFWILVSRFYLKHIKHKLFV